MALAEALFFHEYAGARWPGSGCRYCDLRGPGWSGCDRTQSERVVRTVSVQRGPMVAATAGDHALMAARTAVLARLWGALAREPLDQVAGRELADDRLHVHLTSGEVISGPASAAHLFASPAPGLIVGGHRDPGALAAEVFGDGTFRSEIDNSVTNLAAAYAAVPVPRPGPPELLRTDRDLAFFEQSVVDGHPIHPLCRTRVGMSAAEVRAYAPEYRPRIALEVVEVPPGRWLTGGAPLPPRLAVHPWQRDHVLDRYPGLTPSGQTIPARPLMSLRTVAVAGGTHVKTAVDVQMTSAVRIVSPAAIHNGPVVSELLSRMCRSEPIEVLAETSTGAVLVDGEPDRSLGMVIRRAPRLAAGEVAVPFAVLAAASPSLTRAGSTTGLVNDGVPGGRALLTDIVTDPVADFGRLIGLTLPPLLRLLHRGAALEAHGQNLLVILRDGAPVRLAYRDMGGVRLHPGRLRRAGLTVPPVRGDLVTDDEAELRTKLLAAAVSTVTGQLIAVLAREYGTDPGSLWDITAGVIHRTYAGLPHQAADDRAAILGGPLPIKATTAMRLAARPIEDIWARIPNPMAGR